MKRIIIDTVADYDELIETLKKELPNHHIYGWDEAFHYTVTPQEMVKFIRCFNAVAQKRYQDIQKSDIKVVYRLRNLFRTALDDEESDTRYDPTQR